MPGGSNVSGQTPLQCDLLKFRVAVQCCSGRGRISGRAAWARGSRLPRGDISSENLGMRKNVEVEPPESLHIQMTYNRRNLRTARHPQCEPSLNNILFAVNSRSRILCESNSLVVA